MSSPPPSAPGSLKLHAPPCTLPPSPPPPCTRPRCCALLRLCLFHYTICCFASQESSVFLATLLQNSCSPPCLPQTDIYSLQTFYSRPHLLSPLSTWSPDPTETSRVMSHVWVPYSPTDPSSGSCSLVGKCILSEDPPPAKDKQDTGRKLSRKPD